MNYEAQLTLLSDILKNQQAQNFGTEDEYGQISRITESLQANGQLNRETKELLSSISNYCNSRDCSKHSNDINQWIEMIDDITLI